jgi:phage baseplate assembly protein W
MAASTTPFGILRPFRRTANGDFAAGGGVDAIATAIGQILGTIAATDVTQGEVPWNTTLGSGLVLLRHQRNDAALQETARVYVVDALQRWLPTVRVTGVQIARETQDGEDVLAITVQYSLRPAGSPPSLVTVRLPQ